MLYEMTCYARPFVGENLPQGVYVRVCLLLCVFVCSCVCFLLCMFVLAYLLVCVCVCTFVHHPSTALNPHSAAVALHVSKGRYKQPPQHVPTFVVGDV